jgi:FMN-dependent NADH-azoreductase
MTSVLHISSSARGDESATRSLGDPLAAGLAGDDGVVIERDLTAAVPLLTAEVGSNLGAPTGTADAAGVLAVSDTLIVELKATDALVIGCPVYNFGPPAALKAWADLVAREGHTFARGETGLRGIVEDRPAYIVAASGGVPIGSDFDLATPWLKMFLGFLGITSVTVVDAGGIMMDPEGVMAAAHEQVAELVS